MEQDLILKEVWSDFDTQEVELKLTNGYGDVSWVTVTRAEIESMLKSLS